MNKYPQRPKAKSEEGYVLVAVIFMMVILILSLSVAVPKVREDIQRDRDQETMERGKQYIRAIQLYYRKFQAYPPNVDALVKTNNIRFLRKKYIDPTTGKDEWKPIMFGQNKTPMAMGFFGQPLAGAPIAGVGPGGGNLAGQNGGGNGLFNSNSGTSSAFGSPSTGASSTTDQTGTPTPTGGTNGSNPTTGTSSSAFGPSSTGSAFGSSSNPVGSGQTFGGAGIIGFSPQSPKQSILIYKKKNHYNEWEFLYSPQIDQQQMAAGTGLNGQPASGTQMNQGGTTFGPTPTSPTTPTTPTSPTTPQQ
jgi:type II secretory pathway pseudopilin PulG